MLTLKQEQGHVMPEIQTSSVAVSQDDKKSLSSIEGQTANNSTPLQSEPLQRKSNAPVFRDRLLSDKDVAARYQVEKQTIWRWARTSTSFPKSFKIEGTARWSENELDEHDRKLKEARQ
ncbi:helix-turn-helix transcriptional regulator [Rhizobium panacihumi]|uniref:helix-turn-helix transcriptional regulator n=1 Tax=Rhizobium panacihumi TaxID=2008450 RepID=UPI003D79382F